MTEAKQTFFQVNPESVRDPYMIGSFTIEQIHVADSIRNGNMYLVELIDRGYYGDTYRLSGQGKHEDIILEMGAGELIRTFRALEINKNQVGRTMRALQGGTTVQLGLAVRP